MTSIDSESSESPRRWPERLAIVVLIFTVSVAMGRVCRAEFLSWDDLSTVYQNPWLQPPTVRTLIHYWTTPAGGLYIPVTYTAWTAIAFLAQVPRDASDIAFNPWLFHSANFLCHLIAVTVAYRILRLMKIDRFAAVCGALVFGVHPVQVESVAWVSGLKDVLSGMLALVALWQYVLFALSDKRGRASVIRYALATTVFVLAMLAKPSVMALPLAALAIDRCCVGRPWRRALPAALGWLIIALPLAVIARQVQNAGNTPMHAVWLRPLVVCDSLAFYLAKLIWPLHLAFDYGRTTTKVLKHGWCYWDWIVPMSMAAILIRNRRRHPFLLAAGAIFVAGCLPVLGFTPTMFGFFSTTADHYIYFSMFGPALAVASLLSLRPSLGFRATAAGMLAVLVALTIRQAGYWTNDLTFFTHAVSVNPDSYISYSNIGATYAREHDLSRAVAAYRKAIAVNPLDALSMGSLASALNDLGRRDEAIVEVEKAIGLQIEHPSLRFNWPQDNELLGQLLFDKNRFAQAIPYMRVAVDLEPANLHLASELKEAIARAASQPARK